MTKPPRSRRRKNRASRKEKTVFRLHVEGKVTEREYFRCVKSPDIHLSFAQSAGLDPKSLVRNARSETRFQNLRDRNPTFDELWCVFDVDQHERLTEALSDVRNSGIDVAVSNPCFELWLVLHVRDQNSYTSRTAIQRESRHLHLTEGKNLAEGACDRLKVSTLDAKKRAIELSRNHVETGSGELDNPSCTVWRLVDQITNKS